MSSMPTSLPTIFPSLFGVALSLLLYKVNTIFSLSLVSNEPPCSFQDWSPHFISPVDLSNNLFPAPSVTRNFTFTSASPAFASMLLINAEKSW